MDQLRAMRVFARVIDEGSFARAAQALDIAPAVATRLVAELEEHLSARLIHRTTRRLALTDIGEIYLERVRGILGDIDDAEALAGAATAEPRGTLRVLATPGFAVHQLAPRLPAFHALHPRITVELTVQGMLETVDENHDLTLMVLGKQTLAGNFIARPLATSEVVLCASPAYLARAGRPLQPQDLAEHDTLVPASASEQRSMSFLRPGSDEPPVPVSIRRRPILTTQHVDTVHAATLAGLGIAGLPSFVAAEGLLAGTLVRLLPQWQLLTLRVVAAMPTRKHVPMRTRAFLDFLIDRLGDATRDPWLAAAGCESCA